MWVEGFLQTNPRLQSAMGARLGETLTGSGMSQAGEGSWGLAMPFQACPRELLFLSGGLRDPSFPISIFPQRCLPGWGRTQSQASPDTQRGQ